MRITIKSMGILLLLNLVGQWAFAQSKQSVATPDSSTVQKEVQKNLKDLKHLYPSAEVQFDTKTGLPTNLGSLGSRRSTGTRPRDPEAAVRSFFEEKEVRSVLLYQRVASPQGAVPEQSLRQRIIVLGQQPDPNLPGNTIVRVQQAVGDVPVFGGEAKVQVNQNLEVVGLSASFVPLVVTKTTPTLDAEQAKQKSQDYYKSLIERAADTVKTSERDIAGESPAPGTPVLYIMDPRKLSPAAPDGARLAWVVQVGTFLFFIDADTGGLIHRYRNLNSMLPRAAYDFRGERSGGVAVLNENGALVTPVPPDAQNAFDNVGKALDYYKNVHGRGDLGPSLCSAALEQPPELKLNVRYGSLKNAFWDLQSRQIYFGENYPSSVDVVGHELTHGFIQFISCLPPAGESGAVNESLADFFGQMINRRQGTTTWAIGAQLPGHSPASPLRDMSNPHGAGFNPHQVFSDANWGQPDHYEELVKTTDPLCESSTDVYNDCVHFNSGILNKAQYLMVDGGSHHDVTTTGIGSGKAEAIVYRAMSVHVQGTTSLTQAADALILSCAELQSNHLLGITAQDCASVNKAMKAVGIK